MTGTARQGNIYVVVPVFNRRAFTERFLHCMTSQSFRQFEIIVVDDGSTDSTAEVIAERFPEVQLIRGDGTLWWTGAVNVGIEYAMGRAGADDAILVINNDLEVGPDYLENLHRQWRSKPNTLIGSVAVDIDNPDIIVDGGTIINWWTAKRHKVNSGLKLSQFGKDYSPTVSWLTGRAQAVSLSQRMACNGPTMNGTDRATTTTTLVPPSPVVNKFSPFFGEVGTVVHIRGRYLCNAAVTFNGTPAVTFANTPKRINAIVPTGASTGPIRVTTPEGTIASTGSYTVT